jgi:putative peptide zinc metalloprotease protein
METDGFVTRTVAEAGQEVKKGDVLLEAENPELVAEQKRLLAEVQKFEVLSRQTLAPDKAPVENSIAREQLAAMQKQLAEVNQRIAELTVRAPQDGTLTMRGGSMKQWEGRYLHRGERIASVEDLSVLEVRALVDQQANASGFAEGIKSVELRTSSRIVDNIPTRITRYSQGGTTELPHPAFAAQGGGQIALDPNDKEGTHALRPQFHVWLDLPPVEGKDGKPRPAAVPGERVYVRFTLANKRPLLIQWVHRARQVVRDRLGV